MLQVFSSNSSHEAGMFHKLVKIIHIKEESITLFGTMSKSGSVLSIGYAVYENGISYSFSACNFRDYFKKKLAEKNIWSRFSRPNETCSPECFIPFDFSAGCGLSETEVVEQIFMHIKLHTSAGRQGPWPSWLNNYNLEIYGTQPQYSLVAKDEVRHAKEVCEFFLVKKALVAMGFKQDERCKAYFKY